MVNLKKISDDVKNALKEITEDYSFEAQEIVKSVFLVSNNDIIFGKEVDFSEDRKRQLEKIVAKRKERYPLQYILGNWDFFGREFSVGEGVLIPRADTEVLVEEALKILKPLENPKVLDLCSGSGCIAITLSLEKTCEVTAVEKSEKAFEYLTKNCLKHNAKVNCILGDALEVKTQGEFDLIVSNPPYLTKEDMLSLQAEVKYEPEMALFGMDDGLFFYKNLTRIYKNKLCKNGVLLYEVGDTQSKQVTEILEKEGFINLRQIKDYNGKLRCVLGVHP